MREAHIFWISVEKLVDLPGTTTVGMPSLLPPPKPSVEGFCVLGQSIFVS